MSAARTEIALFALATALLPLAVAVGWVGLNSTGSPRGTAAVAATAAMLALVLAMAVRGLHSARRID